MTACPCSHPITPQCSHTPHLTLQLLTFLVRTLCSFSLITHGGSTALCACWGGRCGWTTPGNLTPLGFQLFMVSISHSPMTGQHRVSPGYRHWHRPRHSHRPEFAASQLSHTNNLGLNVSTHTSVLSLDANTQTVQRSSTLLRDASTQAALHSAAYKDASTQL